MPAFHRQSDIRPATLVSGHRKGFGRSLLRHGYRAGIFVAIGLAWGGALIAPSRGADTAPMSCAHEENIDVAGQALVPLSRRYRRIERVFRRFDSFPQADREGLSLHMEARLEPGNRPGIASGLMMKRGSETVHLIPGPGDEIVLPHDKISWNEDPLLYARLKPEESLEVGFFFTIVPEDPSRFTGEQARRWLSRLDACIEDEGGFLIALLLPDTHRLGLDIAPRSRLEVQENGVTRLLVDNQGLVPYHYVLRPQDFSRQAQFVASKPFTRLMMNLPFSLHGALGRK
ncbi:hypothetical protein [Asaia krungthepensis]|nr:hypothetical protein [Asaia krungthepensis]